MSTPKGDLYFSLCSVSYEKRFYVESHRKSQRYDRALKRKNTKQAKQVFIRTPSLQFKEKVTSALLAADIPLYKLNHTFHKFLF